LSRSGSRRSRETLRTRSALWVPRPRRRRPVRERICCARRSRFIQPRPAGAVRCALDDNGGAPAWLAERPEASLHMAHGGTAYAVLPPTRFDSSVCEQQIEMFSASGQRCGAATFGAGTSGPCPIHDLVVGYDGTVVQRAAFNDSSPACMGRGICTLTFEAWSGFFRQAVLSSPHCGCVRPSEMKAATDARRSLGHRRGRRLSLRGGASGARGGETPHRAAVASCRAGTCLCTGRSERR
jgi:hypothetical protein